MNDLVDRLRKASKQDLTESTPLLPDRISDLLKEAADRIEALELALQDRPERT